MIVFDLKEQLYFSGKDALLLIHSACIHVVYTYINCIKFVTQLQSYLTFKLLTRGWYSPPKPIQEYFRRILEKLT